MAASASQFPEVADAPEEVLKYLANLDDDKVAALLDRARQNAVRLTGLPVPAPQEFSQPAVPDVPSALGNQVRTANSSRLGSSRMCDMKSCDCCRNAPAGSAPTEVEETFPPMLQRCRNDVPPPMLARGSDDAEGGDLVDVEIKLVRSAQATARLIRALDVGNIAAAEDALPGADLVHAGEDGWTPLHTMVHLAGLALPQSSTECRSGKALDVPTGGEFNLALDEYQPGCDCCVQQQSDIKNRDLVRKVLITRNGATVDARASDGATPLMFAADAGDAEVCQLLLAARADPTLKDDDGDTALDWAASRKHSMASELLRDAMTAKKV